MNSEGKTRPPPHLPQPGRAEARGAHGGEPVCPQGLFGNPGSAGAIATGFYPPTSFTNTPGQHPPNLHTNCKWHSSYWVPQHILQFPLLFKSRSGILNFQHLKAPLWHSRNPASTSHRQLQEMGTESPNWTIRVPDHSSLSPDQTEAFKSPGFYLLSLAEENLGHFHSQPAVLKR